MQENGYKKNINKDDPGKIYDGNMEFKKKIVAANDSKKRIKDNYDDDIYYQKKKDSKVKDTKIKELEKQIMKLKSSINQSKTTTKVTINSIIDNNKALQIICPVTYDIPLIFTTKKIKIKVDRLDGIIDVSKGKETFFCLDTINTENPFIHIKKPQLNMQGNISIYNTETGHIYTAMIIGEKYYFSNRPCIPLGIDFEGYVQLNLLVTYN